MINYSYYPILNTGIRIKELDEQSVLYAKENIEKYNPTNISNLDLTVWLISTIILRNLNNNYLTRKFVANYGKMFETRCLKDFMNKEIRVEILDYFKVEDKDVIYDSVHKQPFVKIHCIDYLELLEEGLSVQAPQFDLVNQTLYNGFVYLEYQRFIYLLRLSLEQRLYQKIKSMKVYKDNDLINECVSVLKGKYPEYDKQRAPSKGNIPESIKELIEIAYRDHHLGHRQRIKLGIYLQSNGFDMEFILDIFRQLSDWNEKVTRYQLNSLKRYINK